MNGLIPEAYAQAGAAPAGSQFAPLVMMVLFIFIFYFIFKSKAWFAFHAHPMP